MASGSRADRERAGVVGLVAALELDEPVLDPAQRLVGLARVGERRLQPLARRSARPRRPSCRSRRRCRARAARRRASVVVVRGNSAVVQAPSIVPQRPDRLGRAGAADRERAADGRRRPRSPRRRRRARAAARQHSVHSAGPGRSKSWRLRNATASSGSSCSCAAVRSTWRLKAVSEAAGAPRPATSPTTTIQPPLHRERVVEVAADPVLLPRRPVERGEREAGDLRQRGRQQRALERAGDRRALAVEPRVLDRDAGAPPDLLAAARGRPR